ncbi:MAG: electron transfer flavoprotein subunit alpha/FixB family protein [Anaerolineae bacterium]
MQTIWVLGEVRDGEVKKVTYELLTAARELGDDAKVTVVIAGDGLDSAAAEIVERGADSVLALSDPGLARYSPDAWAAALAGLARSGKPDVILGSSTARGRDLTPRLAAELGVDMASDVVELTVDGDRLAALRPIYAGKALERVTVSGSPRIVTVRPNSYPAAEAAGGGGTTETVAPTTTAPRAVVTTVEASESARPDVAEADVIVAGGRGLGGPEHFAMLEELADQLGAAIGASRAVVDAGWRPHSEQVGQTGKTVAPTLYIACGISGAVQHVAGMKTSKTIVAINKDAEAPIFGLADYGIIGDVFEVVPAVTAALRELETG